MGVTKYISELCNLFDKKELIYVKLFDNDEVEEKNLLRSNQNFEVEDLMKQKAEVLGERHAFDYNISFIDENNIESLDNFDDIILGVDNNKTRKLVYDYALSKGKYLLDLRAQGTVMAFIVVDGKQNMDYYNKKYFSNEEIMARKGSCQLTQDIENDHIENGNKAIAYFGVWCIYFKHLRNEETAIKEWRLAY